MVNLLISVIAALGCSPGRRCVSARRGIMEGKLVTKMLLGTLVLVLLGRSRADGEEPVGRMFLEEVFVAKSIAEQMGDGKSPALKNFLLTCSTRKACS